ncbi:MAG: putative peptidoglycan glycosyltransferase FtsW [Eubacteriales bacterium]|jgi:cell division protein FtsW|nr:putative peptidoglycan glycosyltransferase FtsW [Eubacteriales bacterium]
MQNMNTRRTQNPAARKGNAAVSAKKQKKRSADFIKPTDIVRVRADVDRPMLVIIILLLCFGSIMVFSASYAYALKKYVDSYYFIKRQLLFGSLGLGAMFLAVFFDYRWIKKITLPFFVAITSLLAVTPILAQGGSIARRWIVIPGIGVRFQPSEIMKLALVLFLAWYFERYQKYITDYSDFRRSSVYGVFMPVGVIAFICLLIALENHFSGMIIMFLIGMIVIFAGGARKIWFAIAGAGAGVFAALAITMSDYARQRVDVWLHPENYSAQDEVWQTIQGLIAVGSGGFFGVGLGNSRQKHLFVSEPQNDFIFSIICEELGFVGAVMVILLFIIFIWRGIIIALRAPDTFSSLVVVGIVGKVAVQALLNMAVVTAMIPNTGISLPFFSYGGTALAMLLGEMGIILSISRYSYEIK